MQFHFNIHYQTGYGQRLTLVGDVKELGGWNWMKAPKMEWHEGGYWTLSIFLPTEFQYKYVITEDWSNNTQWENIGNRIVKEKSAQDLIYMEDYWNSSSISKVSRTKVRGIRKFRVPTPWINYAH